MQERSHDPNALAAFIEGRLDERDKQQVTAHLAECAECRRTLAELGRAAAAGALGRASAAKGAGSGSRWTAARVWLPLAASVVLGTFGWLLYLNVRGPTPDVNVRGPAPADEPTLTPEELEPEELEQLLARRSAARTAAGKTFRMSGGEWIDTGFDASAAMPEVAIRGAAERAAWLDRLPQLAPYAELGERVLVVWDGTVYRFSP